MSEPRNWRAILEDAKARGIHRSALARELGVFPAKVSEACVLWGIDLPRGRAGQPPKTDWPKVLIAAERAGKTLGDVAKQVGVSKPAVHKHAMRHGIKLRNARHSSSERAA